MRGLVASTTRMPTQEEQQRLDARIPNGYAYVERGYQSLYPIFLRLVGIALVVVALGSTLRSLGGGGGSGGCLDAGGGRSLTVGTTLACGGSGGVVAVLGTALGCVSGIVSVVTLLALSRREIGQSRGRERAGRLGDRVPWDRLAVLVVGLPPLAALSAALSTRSRSPMVRRLRPVGPSSAAARLLRAGGR